MKQRALACVTSGASSRHSWRARKQRVWNSQPSGRRSKLGTSLAICRKDNRYYSKNVGALSDPKEALRNVVHFKYLGFPLLINDRIFIFEYESIIQDMVSGTILYTGYRNRVDILTGVQCTLAGRRSREPAAGKVIVEFLGRQIDVRRALRGCGLFAHDSDEVAASIRQRLDNHIAPDAFVLLASEQ